MTKPSRKTASSHLSDVFKGLQGLTSEIVTTTKEVANDAVQEIREFGQDIAHEAGRIKQEAASELDRRVTEYGEDCCHTALDQGYPPEQAAAIGRFVTENRMLYKAVQKPVANDSGPSTPQA